MIEYINQSRCTRQTERHDKGKVVVGSKMWKVGVLTGFLLFIAVSPLLESLESGEMVTLLLDNVFHENVSESSLLSAVKVLLCLLENNIM